MKQATLKVGMRVRVIGPNLIGEVIEVLENGAVVKVGKKKEMCFAHELRRD